MTYRPLTNVPLVLIIVQSLALAVFAQSRAIMPDRAVQEQIERVSVAFSKCEESKCDKAFAAAIHELCELEKVESTLLYPQLVLYLSQASEATGYPLLAAIGRYADIPQTHIVRSLLPYLSVENLRQRKLVQDFLGSVEGTGDSRPDFACYWGVLHDREAAPPIDLIEHMFRRSPDAAVNWLAQLWIPNGDRAIVWGVHVVDDWAWKNRRQFIAEANASKPAVRESLEKLASHDRWWVRYYVATVLQRFPPLRDPLLTSTIAKDAHPALERLLKSIDNP